MGKRLLGAADARGLGRRLTHLTLDTNDALPMAIALSEASVRTPTMGYSGFSSTHGFCKGL